MPESRERLQEERHPGAPCRVSSDDVWRVAINEYETAKLKHHNFANYTSATTADCFCSRLIELWGIGGGKN